MKLIRDRFRGGSLAGTALETFVLRSLIFVLSVAVNIVVSRGLGPDGRGAYVLITLSATTIVVFGKLGLQQANIYLIGTRRVDPRRVSSQNLLVAGIAGIAGVVLLLLAPVLLPSVFGGTAFVNLAIGALTVPILLHTQLATGLQNLMHVVSWQFKAAFVGFVAQLGLIAILIALGGMTVTSALIAYAVGAFVTWLLVVSRDTRPATRPFVSGDTLRATLRYSLVVHVGLILLFLQTRMTLFLVQALLGTAALGVYSLAVTISESVLLTSDSLAFALLPRQTHATLRAAAADGLRAARYGGGLTIAGAVPLLVFGPLILRVVFGADFEPSYGPLVALLPGAVFLAVQRFCGAPTLRADRPVRFAGIFAVGVAANVALAVWWIPAAGLLGAAAATSGSYLITVVMFVVWARSLRDSNDTDTR